MDAGVGFKEATGVDVEMTGYTEIDTYTAAVKQVFQQHRV